MAAVQLTTFTDANFDREVLQSPQPVLVDFGAAWCPPCRALLPVVAQLATQYAGTVKMGKLDIDDDPRAPTRYDVRSVPTLLLFHEGRVVGQIVGAAPKAKIEALLARSVVHVADAG